MQKILGFILISLIMSGCSSHVMPIPELVTPAPNINGYPPPPTMDALSYPGPAFITPVSPQDTSSLLDSLTIPTPAAGLAVVYGQLQTVDSAGKVYLAGDIYLAPVIYSEGQLQIPFVSLDVDQDPKASQRTKDQNFLFTNVPPGTYGIIIHTPVSDYVVPDKTDGLRYIEIKPGDSIDLGIIVIE